LTTGTIALMTACLLVTSSTGGAGASTASDQAQAKKQLLTLPDMPSGWKTERGSTVTTNGKGPLSRFPGDQQLASCLGLPLSVISSNPPQATSPYFENKGGSLEVQDSVSVFGSAKDASTQYDALRNGNAPSCLTQTFNSASARSQFLAGTPKGTTLGIATVTALNPSTYGKNTAGFIATFPVTAGGISVSTRLTAVLFIKGRLGGMLSLDSYAGPFPTSLSKHLTSLAESRLHS
jgi:hypothetical protein